MIYFDNAATTKPYDEVLELFAKLSKEQFGNSSSTHFYGRDSSKKLEESREHILSLLGLNKTHKLVFESCASEANNSAIKGVAYHYANRGKRIITTEVEHPSVLNAFRALENEGYQVVYLPVNSDGVVEPKALEASMTKDTILVSIMSVNNETGAIFPISKYADIIHKYPKCFFHVDATQSIGKIKMDYTKCDMLSFSSHKIGGLKGNGVLIMKKTMEITPLLDGGEQETGLRAGTIDMPGSVAMDLALTTTLKNLNANQTKAKEIKQYLQEELSKIGEVVVNSPANSIPFILNISLLDHKASVVLEALSQKGICVSSVSACSSKGEPISYVLSAMGKDEVASRNSIRISLSHENTMEEAKEFISIFNNVLSTTVGREFVK